MNTSLINFLGQKHILVSDAGKNQAEALYALMNKLNIKVTKGFQYASIDVVRKAEDIIGEWVPESFYRGFPQSVLELTPDQLLFDQLTHYCMTYGFGNFEEVGHSLLEDARERSKFNEQGIAPHEFVILTEDEARVELAKFVAAMCESTRPLNESDLGVICDAIEEGFHPANIASKQNAIAILIKTRNLAFVRYIQLNDVIKLVDTINYENHGRKLNYLALTSSERKLVTRVLDTILTHEPSANVLDMCIEKRDTWKGLLHHIHYKAKSDVAQMFLNTIFRETASSMMGLVESLIKTRPDVAANILRNTKGDQALLRNLNWMIQSGANKNAVMDLLENPSPLVLMQLRQRYANYNPGCRTFRFVKHNKIVTHTETERKHHLSAEDVRELDSALESKLMKVLRGRINGKVFIADDMKNIAVPTNAATGESGFGIMPTGSRIKLPEGKKIRAFTYWEKVNDIDLACFGIDAAGNRIEFSWRTMYSNQSEAIAYSGDETSGYNGGSEFFDINFDAMRKVHPELKYFVFTDNVYSASNFSDCICRAGWMARDNDDSGEVYEPKTVRSAYTINAKSTFAYLYAIDIEKREVIWLNLTDSNRATVAGAAEFSWIYDYFNVTETMNMHKLFTAMAKEVVNDPEEADLVIGDVETTRPQIHSYDFEKVFPYLR